MYKQGWPQNDEFFALVEQAHEAMHALAIKTHYMACERVMRKGK